MTEIDGVVRFGDIKRGKREIFVTPIAPDGAGRDRRAAAVRSRSRQAPSRARGRPRALVTVSQRDQVNPHDILRIKGPRAVQEYLLNEVQEVYRLQGGRSTTSTLA